MLDSVADGREQFEAIARAQLSVVAVIGDWDAPSEFHDEVGEAGGGLTGIEHPGDIGMVHQGQRLALGLKTGDDLAAVHSRLEDLDGDFPAHRVLLLGDKDQAEPPFTDLLQQLVRADHPAGAYLYQYVRRRGGRVVQEGAGLAIGEQ